MEFRVDFETEAEYDEFDMLFESIDHIEEVEANDETMDVEGDEWIEVNEESINWLQEFRPMTKPGSKIDAEMIPKPIDAFNLFFTFEILNNIVIWSNNEGLRRDPNFPTFDMEELKKVLGCQIVMGINRFKDELDNWSTRRFLGNNDLRQVLSRNR